MKTKVAIRLDCTELDSAIEKVNRLIELLREAQQIAALVRSTQERQKVVLGDIELNTTGFFDDSKFKERETLPKVQIKSPDGVHGEVWIDGQKLRGVRRVDFSLDAERTPAQEMVLHLLANVDIETCVAPKFAPYDLIKK